MHPYYYCFGGNKKLGSAEVVQFGLIAANSLTVPVQQRTTISLFAASNLIPKGRQINTATMIAANSMAQPTQTTGTITAIAGSSFPAQVLSTDGIICPAEASIPQGSYFTWADPVTGLGYYAWFNEDGGGSDPGAGDIGIEIDISSGDTGNAVALSMATSFRGAGFSANVFSTAVCTVEQINPGPVSYFDSGASGCVIINDIEGATSWIHFYNGSQQSDYYIWFNVNGADVDPGAQTQSELFCVVNINSTDNSTVVAQKLLAAIQASPDYGTLIGGVTSANISGHVITLSFGAGGSDLNDNGTGCTCAVTIAGTFSPYIQFSTTLPGDAYIWFDRDGGGSDPGSSISPPSGSALRVSISSGDSASTVAIKAQAAILSQAYCCSAFGSLLTMYNQQSSGGQTLVDNGTGIVCASIPSGNVPYLYGTNPAIGPYYIWYNINSAGGDPALAGCIGVSVAVTGSETAPQLATKTNTAMSGAGMSTTVSTSTVTLTEYGPSLIPMVNGGILANATGLISTSGIQRLAYFTFNDPILGLYVIWFNVNGHGVRPSISGSTSIQVVLATGATVATVCSTLGTALTSAGFSNVVSSPNVTLTNLNKGAVSAPTNVNVGTGTSVTIITQGR